MPSVANPAISRNGTNRQTRKTKREQLKSSNAARQSKEVEAEIHKKWEVFCDLEQQAKEKKANASRRDQAWNALYNLVHFALDDHLQLRFPSKEDSKGFTYFELVAGTGRYFRLTDADLPQELPSGEQRQRLRIYSIPGKKQEASDHNEQNDLAFGWRHYTTLLVSGKSEKAQAVLKTIIKFGEGLPARRQFRAVEHDGIQLVEFIRGSGHYLGLDGDIAVDYFPSANEPMRARVQRSIGHRSARMYGFDRADWMVEHN